MNTQQGFTLLEVMVALFVFSFLSLMAYQGINALVGVEQQSRDATVELSELQRAMMIWERDVRQIVNRPISQETGNLAAAVTQDDGAIIEFTTVGYYDWQGRFKHNTQRVRYRLEDKQLIREVWHLADHLVMTNPQKTVLLRNILSAQVEIEANQSETNEENTGILAIPNALLLRIEHQKFGEISRILMLHAP